MSNLKFVQSISCSVGIALCVSLLSVTTNASELELTLESGSVLRSDVSDSAINWTEVLPDGETKSRSIRLSDIQRLTLCETPASQKVSEIRKLLTRLQSDIYLEREAAEQELSSPDIGGRFPKLIEMHANSERAEVKHRIERILGELDDSNSTVVNEFDRLQMKTGRELSGDAGDFEISTNVDGQNLKLQRNQLRMIRSVANINSKTDNQNLPAKVEILHSPEGNFYQAHQQTIDFEEDSNDNRLTLTANINQAYVPLGIRFRPAKPGYIGISGYGFKFPNTPTGNNSACVFDTVTRPNYPVRFRGTLEVNFCMPNQPNAPAGVHEFGMYIARVNRERDFILEARNARGQILATVEAGAKDCVFMGLRSDEPIAHLRLYSNPHLKKLKRVVDKDFAFDAVCFSAPQPIPDAPAKDRAVVKLRNGNLWTAHRLELNNEGSVELVTDQLERRPVFDLSDVSVMTFANRAAQKKPVRRSWSVQLPDGSILNVSPGKTMASQLMPKHSFAADDIVGFWPSDSPARRAQPGDFDNGQQVIVFPTCRMTTGDVRFSSDRFSWKTKETLLQNLGPAASNLAAKENPAPDVDEIPYKSTQPDETPTLWLKPPTAPPTGAGQLKLKDGQCIVFGDGASFQFKELRKREAELAFGQTSLRIPIDRIQSIQFESQP